MCSQLHIRGMPTCIRPVCAHVRAAWARYVLEGHKDGVIGERSSQVMIEESGLLDWIS